MRRWVCVALLVLSSAVAGSPARAMPVVSGVVETDVRWTRWTVRLPYGERTLLEGQVVSDEEGALAEVEVGLYARRADLTGWTRVGVAVTSSDNAVFRFDQHLPDGSTEYRAVYEGDLLHAGAEGRRTVGVSRRVDDALRSRREGAVFSGRVSPRYAGRPVVVQRKTCGGCGWQRLTVLRTSDRSRWRTTVGAPPAGSAWRFRVVVPADARFLRSRGSGVWVLRARRG